jgi:NAD(P)-dependent dehydrogenase (short-subunit alcohol dehydrogenase family)
VDQVHTSVTELLDLSGKVALVTGANGGIGRGIARRLAEAGAAVGVHYRSGETGAKDVVSTIESVGGRAHTVHAELTDTASVESALDAVGETLGQVDILVNNAARQTHATLEEMDLDEWRGMLATNLDGVFLITKLVTNRMIARGSGGAVINIASIEGLQPSPTHGHYATSKAGLIMFTRAAALGLGRHGIRVNSVSPGVIHREGIETAWPEGVKRWMDAVPLGRMGTDEDVADAVLFLASPASRWITGANLVVDGGVTAGPAF